LKARVRVHVCGGASLDDTDGGEGYQALRYIATSLLRPGIWGAAQCCAPGAGSKTRRPAMLNVVRDCLNTQDRRC
jgi:hypothetical protein